VSHLESAAAEPALTATAIARALHGAFCRGVPSQELLRLASTKIHESGPPYSHVYMYRLQPDDTLALVAYSGQPPDANSINAPSGQRRRAVIDRTNSYMPRINPRDQPQTHSSDTQSELVILIRRHDEVIGAIDIESDLPDAFNDVEQTAVVEVADALAALL
jgi:putative methionine-R-sulfoxide reductase with GAF domain